MTDYSPFPAPAPGVADKLLHVVHHIRKHPELFEMSDWCQHTECGTVACLAGHTVILDQLERGTILDPALVYAPDSWGRKAEQILGLTVEEAGRLFHVSDWPEQFCTEFKHFRRAMTSVERALNHGLDGEPTPSSTWTPRERAVVRNIASRMVDVLERRVNYFLYDESHA